MINPPAAIMSVEMIKRKNSKEKIIDFFSEKSETKKKAVNI